MLSFVLWSFQVLGKDSIDYGIRSGKSLSLGIPKSPQGNIQGSQEAKLGDAPAPQAIIKNEQPTKLGDSP